MPSPHDVNQRGSPVNVKSLAVILNQHEAFLAGHHGGRRAMLKFRDLSDLNLSGRHLCDADLTGANLTRCILRQTDLSGATLFGAEMTHADMRRARLVRADLRGVQMADACLAGADLSRSDFREGR